jgi:hypothetical protein
MGVSRLRRGMLKAISIVAVLGLLGLWAAVARRK